MARREEAVHLATSASLRMWEFYLASSEMAFRKQNLMNFQIELTRRQGIVPATRDYIAREEARLRGLERGKKPQFRIAGEWPC
jgi:cyclopropane-fatty-acyl-phospholipid synthase